MGRGPPESAGDRRNGPLEAFAGVAPQPSAGIIVDRRWVPLRRELVDVTGLEFTEGEES
jgi:hypothetical protein